MASVTSEEYVELALHGLTVVFISPLLVLIAVLSVPFWVVGWLANRAGWKPDVSEECDGGW